MKKAKFVAKPAAEPTTLELRRWCIEQASRWPTEREGGMGGVYSGGGGYRMIEADLLGRAEKILKWVQSA